MSETTGWYELTFESEEVADRFFRGLDESDEESLDRIGLDEAWLDLALGGGEVTVEYGDSDRTIRVLVELETTPFEEAIRELAKRVAVHGCWLGYDSRTGGYDFCSIESGRMQAQYSTQCGGKFDEVIFENHGWRAFEKSKSLWKAGEFAQDEGYQRAIEKMARDL